MFARALAMLAAAASLAYGIESAFSLDETIRVKPGDGHVSVAAEKTDSGRLRFTITRDPARNPDKSRHGHLSVANKAGVLAECSVESAARDGHTVFEFHLAVECVPHSTFTLNEVVQDKEGLLQVGGATILEIRPADFLPAAKAAVGPSSSVGVREYWLPRVYLADGVYPVAPKDLATNTSSAPTVTLAVVPVDASESGERQTIEVTTEPLLRFRGLKQFDFKFENNQCTQISFPNTENLRAYTRDHVGARLAVVIDNRVITHHKIREPIKSAMVRITCCTVGGGDHLHKHLQELAAEE